MSMWLKIISGKASSLQKALPLSTELCGCASSAHLSLLDSPAVLCLASRAVPVFTVLPDGEVGAFLHPQEIL